MGAQRVFSAPRSTPQLMPVSWSASTPLVPPTRSPAQPSTLVDLALDLPQLPLPLLLQLQPALQLPVLQPLALPQPPSPQQSSQPPRLPHQLRMTTPASKHLTPPSS